MPTVFFSDEAYQDFDQLSRMDRDLVNDLYEALCRLERDGMPPQALPVADLVDIDGLAVPGYLALTGDFVLGLSRAGRAKIIIWAIRLVVRPTAETVAVLAVE